MRRSVLFLLGAMALGTAQAQRNVDGNKFCDNWSIGLNVGTVTPLTNHPFFKSMRPTWGITINKQLSPIYGLTLEGMTSINTNDSYTAFDMYNVSLLNRLNLNNTFVPYKGKPYSFEVEAVGGFGWFRNTNPYWKSGDKKDRDHVSAKAGLNLNFNVGKKKAWTVALKPAVIWDMTVVGREHLNMNADRAAFELTAGVVYRFKNSTGKHYYSVECDRSEIDALNAMISTMRQDIADKDGQLEKANSQINSLQNDLNDCRNKKPAVQQTAKVEQSYFVTFRQGKSSIDPMQMPSIESLAKNLKENSDAKVTISGYASPEGNAEFNQKLSLKRAEAVKKVLVEKYNIEEGRIITEGKGVGSVFGEPNWNRVSICIIK